MIFDVADLELPMRIQTDVCVVGGGPGGCMVAKVAAEAGLRVVLLEAGPFVPPELMSQREEEMIPRLYVANGAQASSEGVKIHQGRGVGGSTLHNLNLCKRIPKAVRRDWRKTVGLESLTDERWDELYSRVEDLLDVKEIKEEDRNLHNRILERGCRELDWQWGALSHNRTGCIGSGYCALGCRYDAKNNAAKVLIPPAIKAGLDVLTHCKAIRVQHDGSRVNAVKAVALDPLTRRPNGELHIQADFICLAASATGTPPILWRSEIGDPGTLTGRGLHVHPGLFVAGEFGEEIKAWEGVPQSCECTEFLDFDRAHSDEDPVGSRAWIVPAFSHPMTTGTLLPDTNRAHREVIQRYDHLAVMTCMIHDRTSGRIDLHGEYGRTLSYWPNEKDRAELRHGMAACVRLMFASGARRVVVPTDPITILNPGDSLAFIESLPLTSGTLDLHAVHPMGTVPMGDSARRNPVDSMGRHHHVEGLWVADGSLFPTSIGVPPQLSIYAMGLHVGESIVSAAR